MATTLPNPFAWQSNHNSRYLHLDGKIESQEGILDFTEEDPNYIFEPEDTSGYVKIKCSKNYLYLAGVRITIDQISTWLIVAADPKATNATDDEDSTLFVLEKSESTNDTQVVFRLRHVKSNLYLRPDKVPGGSDAVLCAVSTDPDPEGVDLFTAFSSP